MSRFRGNNPNQAVAPRRRMLAVKREATAEPPAIQTRSTWTERCARPSGTAPQPRTQASCVMSLMAWGVRMTSPIAEIMNRKTPARAMSVSSTDLRQLPPHVNAVRRCQRLRHPLTTRLEIAAGWHGSAHGIDKSRLRVTIPSTFRQRRSPHERHCRPFFIAP